MDDPHSPPPQPNLSQKAYDSIHESILAGRLAVGSVVSEAALAKSLGISRTPVGEAIRQLAREGFVQQIPRFGTIVRQIDRRELIELYEVREGLESFAAAKIAADADPAVVAGLKQLCRVMQSICDEIGDAAMEAEVSEPILRRFLAADQAFHMAILEATGNRKITDSVRTMKTLSRVFRLRRCRYTRQAIVSAAECHHKIADAIASGEPERARIAMTDHIRASRLEAIAFLDAERTRDNNAATSSELAAALVRDIGEIGQADHLVAAKQV
jgi:DNA-binding GntR family transcriptional regulator